MKKWIHASDEVQEPMFQEGDKVTVIESKVGYSNYEGIYRGSYVNRYGQLIFKIQTGSGIEDVHSRSVIPSQLAYFNSLSREDVLTKDFVGNLIHRDDSMWCDKVRYKRVDNDRSMENVSGIEALISNNGPDKQIYRVAITSYVSKHYSETQDLDDNYNVELSDPLIEEALSIMSESDKVVVNFAGHQRIFK